LWRAFWIWGVLGMAIAMTVFVGLGAAFAAAATFSPTLVVAVQLFILLGYAGFSSLVLWRSAKDPKESGIHALAKVYAVMSFAFWLCVVGLALAFR